MPKVGFFPGSTIGNFEPHEARAFLRSAREILGEGAQMIIGVDLEKDERVLYDAYNDAAGVTARFNLNVLVRINRELGGNFDLSAFIHRSIYNRERHRIEMHLIAKKAQTVRMLGHEFLVPPRREHPHREQLQIQPRALHRAGARVRLAGAGILDRRGPDVFGSRAGGVRLRDEREPFSRSLQGGPAVQVLTQSPAHRPQPASRSDPGRDRYPVIGQSVCTQQPRVNDPPLVLSARLEIQQRRSGSCSSWKNFNESFPVGPSSSIACVKIQRSHSWMMRILASLCFIGAYSQPRLSVASE